MPNFYIRPLTRYPLLPVGFLSLVWVRFQLGISGKLSQILSAVSSEISRWCGFKSGVLGFRDNALGVGVLVFPWVQLENAHWELPISKFLGPLGK